MEVLKSLVPASVPARICLPFSAENDKIHLAARVRTHTVTRAISSTEKESAEHEEFEEPETGCFRKEEGRRTGGVDRSHCDDDARVGGLR